MAASGMHRLAFIVAVTATLFGPTAGGGGGGGGGGDGGGGIQPVNAGLLSVDNGLHPDAGGDDPREAAVGELIKVTGRVSTVQEDDFANSQCRRHTVLQLDEAAQHSVSPDGARVRSLTFPATAITAGLAHGGEATLTLRQLGNNTLVPVELHEFARSRRGYGAYDEVGTGNGASVPATALMNAAVPNRSVLVLRVTYNGVAPSYCDDTCATNIMWGAGDSVGGFFEEQSGQSLTFAQQDGVVGTVALTGTLDAADSCPFIELADAADAAVAAQLQVDPAAYSHIVYYVPLGFGTCLFTGLGVVACAPGDGCRTWIRDASPMSLAHELGHNFGMHHAAVDADDDGWAESEFGDTSDMMAGGLGQWRGFNGAHRVAMGWVPTVPVYTPADCGAHAITLTSLSLAVAPQGSVRAAQIPRSGLPAGAAYVLSLRTTTGYDANLTVNAPAFADRVAVHHIGMVTADHSAFITALPMGGSVTLDGWTLSVVSIGSHAATVVLAFCGDTLELPPVVPAPTASCASLGWPISLNAPRPVCGESHIAETCHRDVTYGTAMAICGSVGARLCSADEVAQDAVIDTGCALDQEYIWTSTTCSATVDAAPVPGSVVRLGSGDTSLNTESPDYCGSVVAATAAVRCCAEDPTAAPTNPAPSPAPTPYPCPDLLEGSRCAEWAAAGHCDHPTLAGYVRTNCERSCGVTCVPKPPAQALTYIIASTAEGCHDALGLLTPITTRAACEAAARALDLPIDIAARINGSYVPSGCYYVQPAVPTSRQLWFNYYPGSTEPPDGQDRIALCTLVG